MYQFLRVFFVQAMSPSGMTSSAPRKGFPRSRRRRPRDEPTHAEAKRSGSRQTFFFLVAERRRGAQQHSARSPAPCRRTDARCRTRTEVHKLDYLVKSLVGGRDVLPLCFAQHIVIAGVSPHTASVHAENRP